MNGFNNNEMCPRCGHFVLKTWNELTGDEKLLAERLPASAEFTAEERRRHRFCTRCWHEEPPDRKRFA